VVKAVTWRAGGTVITGLVAWVLTGNLKLSAGIGLMDTALKIGAFYAHERFWNRISFGKMRPPDYQI
jgi:bifunctional enzyme CysN/CysC/sulfate adenylyltransferase subunit 1